MPAPFVTRQSKTRVQRDPERGAGHSGKWRRNGDRILRPSIATYFKSVCVCHFATSAVPWLESKRFVRPAKMNFTVADAHCRDGKHCARESKSLRFLNLNQQWTLATNRIDEQTRFSYKSQALRYPTMKLCLPLGLVLLGLLCGCGSGGQGGQTAMPNSSHRLGPPPIAAHAGAHRR